VPSHKVHKRLTLLAAHEAGLPQELIEGLLEGATEPDEIPDRKTIVGFLVILWVFPALMAGLYLALKWTPEEYIIAMRAGVHKVTPPSYVTAI